MQICGRAFAYALLSVIAAGANRDVTAAPEQAVLKSESFDRDPGWEALNNRIVPEKRLTVTQDFGYNAATGDMGGRLTRTMKPAYYAAAFDKPKTLDEKLSASGTFYLSASTGGSGVFFGWFNAEQREGTGRPIGSLGLHFDAERGGGRLAVRLLTRSNRGCGKFVTKFERYRTSEERATARPTPIRNDGTRYAWTLTYDPDAAGGNGQVLFTVKGNAAEPADFEGKPVTFDLPPGYKAEGATFDRFGLMNGTKPGGTMTIHFDDLSFDGKTQDFAADPGWAQTGNRSVYEESTQVGTHNFGFSPGTNHAGGARAGEMGGDLWRSGKYAHYADRVGPLTMNDRLEARGKVVLAVGAPDSDVFLGWFGGDSKDQSPLDTGKFIGVHVGGPTRVGHYFHPALAVTPGKPVAAPAGPVMRQGEVYNWSLLYDPAAENGHGAITVTLGDETVTMPLKQGLRAKGGRFDRFGLLNSPIGGQLVRIYLDDVTYTARGTAR